MAPAIDLPELRDGIERATEIVPGRWIGDDEIVELEERYELLLFERFADGTLLVTPPAGWRSDSANTELTRQVANWVRGGKHGLVMGPTGGVRLPDGSLFAPDGTYISAAR